MYGIGVVLEWYGFRCRILAVLEWSGIELSFRCFSLLNGMFLVSVGIDRSVFVQHFKNLLHRCRPSQKLFSLVSPVTNHQ